MGEIVNRTAFGVGMMGVVGVVMLAMGVVGMVWVVWFARFTGVEGGPSFGFAGGVLGAVRAAVEEAKVSARWGRHFWGSDGGHSEDRGR